jgi:hypothetical protein
LVVRPGIVKLLRTASPSIVSAPASSSPSNNQAGLALAVPASAVPLSRAETAAAMRMRVSLRAIAPPTLSQENRKVKSF